MTSPQVGSSTSDALDDTLLPGDSSHEESHPWDYSAHYPPWVPLREDHVTL
jgi:hypothetical protein